MKKLLLLAATLLLIFNNIHAADYSYIYIQGDGETPFYVKLEGQMLPRLGKNYCIISNLDAGVTHIQILFQQNTYPQQDFAIRIPENGSRGFVLQKVNDNQFALMDLHTKKFIVAGNDTDESDVADDLSSSSIASSEINDVELPSFPNKKPVKNPTEKKGNTTDDRFLSDVELNNAKPKEEPLPEFGSNSDASKTKNKNRGKVVDTEDNIDNTVFDTPKKTSTEPIANSDCPQAMSNDEFESLALKILDKSDDQPRLRFINKTGIKYCYNTEQVRILANNIESQSARYELVNTLYPRVVDQENYSKLENLFSSSFLKKKFLEMLK